MHLHGDRDQFARYADVALVAAPARTLNRDGDGRQPREQEAPKVRSLAVQPGRSPVGQ